MSYSKDMQELILLYKLIDLVNFHGPTPKTQTKGDNNGLKGLGNNICVSAGARKMDQK